MKLKNILIVVNNIEASKRFYKDLFGLDTVMDNEGNAILTEGLVLQDKQVWETCIQKPVITQPHDTVLFFEETDIERFLKKLEESNYEIEFIHKDAQNSLGRRIIRMYDLDGHVIEIGGK